MISHFEYTTLNNAVNEWNKTLKKELIKIAKICNIQIYARENRKDGFTKSGIINQLSEMYEKIKEYRLAHKIPVVEKAPKPIPQFKELKDYKNLTEAQYYWNTQPRDELRKLCTSNGIEANSRKGKLSKSQTIEKLSELFTEIKRKAKTKPN
jgi:hypothetical protein